MNRIVLAAVLVLAAAFANAQNMPPGKWWQKPEIVQHLQLTNDQQDKLDEIFRGVNPWRRCLGGAVLAYELTTFL